MNIESRPGILRATAEDIISAYAAPLGHHVLIGHASRRLKVGQVKSFGGDLKLAWSRIAAHHFVPRSVRRRRCRQGIFQSRVKIKRGPRGHMRIDPVRGIIGKVWLAIFNDRLRRFHERKINAAAMTIQSRRGKSRANGATARPEIASNAIIAGP